MDRQPPTAEELQFLSTEFQRDPAGHFVALGGALLALGRPADAVDVGTQGLQQVPADTSGRLMVGVALAQLHRWKEAQAELLKVVKSDRNNGPGFRLLGEVLIRRGDFDRALPVLQHAQNLSPSDSAILGLVRCARDGQALPPPPAVPVAITAGSSAPPAPPPAVPPRAMPSPPPALARVELQKKVVVRGHTPGSAEKMSAVASRDSRREQDSSFAPVEIHRNHALENPLSPLGAAQPVRPRVIPAQKPKDAAQEGLHGSAAVGEQYLNHLLLSGLLEVPNVRVADAKYDVAPGKRWGRSSARLFVYLFVVFGAAGAGMGVWNWYAQKQTATHVARHIGNARALIESGDRVELATALSEVRQANERAPSDSYTLAVLAEVTAVASLLHGEFPPAEVQLAVDAASGTLKDPSDDGYREVVIARAAITLAALADLKNDGDQRLSEVASELTQWLERSPDDKFARWLLGRAQLAAGQSNVAMESFSFAHANGDGPAIATVDLANMHLDRGEYDLAMSLYDSALLRSANHELAFVGRSLARSERFIESAEAMADISIGLAQAKGSTLLAWKALALASAQLALEDYEAFSEALDGAKGVHSPRFLARVGLLRIREGQIVKAARTRAEVQWYADDPEVSPQVTMLDVELLLARGLPKVALEALGTQAGGQAQAIRGRALFDMGRAAEALQVFEKSLQEAPNSLVLQAWAESSRMLANKGRTRAKADEALDSIGRKAKSKVVRFVHGTALAATGNSSLAEDKLEQSVLEISSAYPNALAYRSYLALARLAFAKADSAKALAFLDSSAKHNPGYLPARDLLGQVLVASDPGKALQPLTDVLEAGVATVGGELAYARALVKTGGSKDTAAGAIRRAKDRGAGEAALRAAIADVDPALFAELEIAPAEPESE